MSPCANLRIEPRPDPIPFARRLWLSLALALLPSLAWHPAAYAETFRVDLIVFRFLGPAGELGQPVQMPTVGAVTADAATAIDPKDTARLAAAGITVLPDAEFALGPEWASLRSSRDFRPLIRLAWTQKDPPSENGPRLLIRSGAKLTLSAPDGLGAAEVSEIDGSVALLLSRFLHLDTDLVYTQPEGEPQSWHLRERRRMRRDEVHHLDSPRLGILAEVSKVDAP